MDRRRHIKRWCDNMIDFWYRTYCFAIPAAATVAYLIGYFYGKIKIWQSSNYADTLSAVITFGSIIISFFGVLLTLLISVKEKSRLIQFFLDSADKEVFISSIKSLIMFGLLAVMIASCLFMEDILDEWLKVVLSGMGIFSLIRFTTLTYRFTNILLMLFIREKEDFDKKEGPKISEDKADELIRRIKNGI